MTNQQPRIELRKDVPRPFWRLRLFLPTPSGLKRRNFNLGFRDETSRKEANKKRMEILAKANRGELCDSGGMTFRELTEKFAELRLPMLKASTRDFYKRRLDGHLLPHFGDSTLERINRLAIEEFLAGKDKLAWRYRRGILATLSAVLENRSFLPPKLDTEGDSLPNARPIVAAENVGWPISGGSPLG
jgi:hypothetical protein